MANVNCIVLIGHLTRDVDLRKLPSGMAVAEFGIAVNTKTSKDKEEVLFIDCTAFDKRAEALAKYCRKGHPLYIEGRLRLEQWTDRQTEQKRSKHTITVNQFQFLPRKHEEALAAAPAAEQTTDNPPLSDHEFDANDIPL